jgi:hypothetical protein
MAPDETYISRKAQRVSEGAKRNQDITGRFWEMNRFELDCIDDSNKYSLKELIQPKPHEQFSNDDPQ